MSRRPPGFLRQDEDAEIRLMIGTAGHVDHGKTRLVRLLTGCDTDRLKIEKERGLSIELGFAPCRLEAGLAAGIVDVPGHEQFIRNMVAGAAGMDMAILVVAADDGVMPQTLEHLQIMGFLGVQLGIIALTKIDLVSKPRIEEVREQILSLIQGTFLEGATICPVSSETFEGFPEFFSTLVTVAMQARILRQSGVFRMPVERVFSVPGYGTVASGIPLAGAVVLGEELELQPSGIRVRVRGMQRFLRDARQGSAGQCLALNLAGVSQDTIQRGNVLACPGYVSPGSLLQVHLIACSNLSPPLRHNEEIRLHTGTAEVFGQLSLYNAHSLSAGQKGYGMLRLHEAIAASATDHFVLRRNSPTLTVAGGVILRVLAQKPPGRRSELAEELLARHASIASPESRLEYHFLYRGPGGSTPQAAAREVLIDLESARVLIQNLSDRGILIPCTNDHYLHTRGLDAGEQRIFFYLERYYRNHDTSFGPTLGELTDGTHLPRETLRVLLERMIQASRLERSEDRIGLAGRRERFDDLRQSLLHRLEKIYLEGAFASPRPDEIPEKLGASLAQTSSLLEYLCQQRILIRLSKNVWLHEKWFHEAQARVIEAILEKGELESGDFKAVIDSSRKYALAILDYLDTIHVTQRFGNNRRLHPAYLRKHPEYQSLEKQKRSSS